MMSEALRCTHRARNPALPLLHFAPVAVDQGLETGLVGALHRRPSAVMQTICVSGLLLDLASSFPRF